MSRGTREPMLLGDVRGVSDLRVQRRVREVLHGHVLVRVGDSVPAVQLHHGVRVLRGGG